MTGKEVNEDFAMTANYLRITGDGLSSEITHKERLASMAGWNPTVFALQKVDEGQYRVLVGTHLDYKDHFLSRAKGVYIIPINIKK